MEYERRFLVPQIAAIEIPKDVEPSMIDNYYLAIFEDCYVRIRQCLNHDGITLYSTCYKIMTSPSVPEEFEILNDRSEFLRLREQALKKVSKFRWSWDHSLLSLHFDLDYFPRNNITILEIEFEQEIYKNRFQLEDLLPYSGMFFRVSTLDIVEITGIKEYSNLAFAEDYKKI